MPRSATVLALITIALWSFLSYLGANLSHVPPFLLTGIVLCISSSLSAVRMQFWRVPWTTFAIGVGGLFGCHFFFFTAFRYAPAVEVNLLNYLWPLFVVFLSPLFLPGYQLRRHHVLGAMLGFSGATLIVTGGRLGLDVAYLRGYLSVVAGALVWASYSLLTKRVPPFPTAAVGGFCLAAGLLSLVTHFALEGASTVTLAGRDWIFLILLGTGPLGVAFFTWDAALKRGDPRLLGALTYLMPLNSTLVLVALDGQPFGRVSAIAMVLIVAGATVGSLDLLRPARSR